MARFLVVLHLAATLVASLPGIATPWILNGSPVCTAILYQYAPKGVPDGFGGAIITWYDCRNGEANADIYAQRIDDRGNALWAPDGVPVCSLAKSQYHPVIASDGAGGAIIAWYDFRGGKGDIYAQRLDGSGAALWQSGGVPLCTNAEKQSDPVIAAAVGSGGAVVAWLDDRNGDTDIYAQRVNASGAAQWTADGVPVTRASSFQTQAAIVSDGAGGAIIAWTDTRSSWDNDIYAQRIDASGAALWSADGTAISTSSRPQTLPVIVSDGAGGAIIAWEDERNGYGTQDIYAQHIIASGTKLWMANGMPVCQYGGSQVHLAAASDQAGGGLLVWHDNRSVNPGLYAQRVAGDGTSHWTMGGTPVSLVPANRISPAIVSDGAGGGIISWLDFRSVASFDVYAQRLGNNGSIMWPSEGVPLYVGAGDASSVIVCGDGAGGAIAAWQDTRSGSSDIYAQRVRANGDLVSTLLAGFGARLSASGICVFWTLTAAPPEAAFLVQRAEGPGDAFFAPIDAAVSRDGSSFSFVDPSGRASATYRYRVALAQERGAVVLFETAPLTVPAAELALHQNRPNPFNPSTEIRFCLPERARVSLAIFDVRGNLVRTLREGILERGDHTAAWDGRDERGEQAASGIYFCRLAAGKDIRTRKMVLAR